MERLLKAIGFGILVCIVLAIAFLICGASIMLLKYIGMNDTAVVLTVIFIPVFIGSAIITYKYW